jgi:3-oxoacyl-[acyl-carrier-protein] synthase-1
MAAAVGQAIGSWGGDPTTIGAVAIDLNGEADRAREWCATATQTIYRRHATPVLLHPADRLGDIGAASVPLLIGLVVSAQTPGPALIVASSRDGLRGAAVVG